MAQYPCTVDDAMHRRSARDETRHTRAYGATTPSKERAIR
eukprot:SAG11_NODE_25733_length_354_cov_5.505882_1_plen_39_part_01